MQPSERLALEGDFVRPARQGRICEREAALTRTIQEPPLKYAFAGSRILQGGFMMAEDHTYSRMPSCRRP